MATPAGRWSDLGVRIVSALVLVVVSGLEIWAGGVLFHVFVATLCGAMGWELARMLAGPEKSGQAMAIGVLSGVSCLAALWAMPVPLALLVPPVILAIVLRRDRLIGLGYLLMILLAGYQIVAMRDAVDGALWLMWLILIVVASDVAGYFAGRALGGPKFWPRVSPKKTWSGTIAGWIGGAVVGLGYVIATGAPVGLIPLSVLVAFAAQMGDIAESAIKRHVGIKDSSNLIPGHGGVLDRFDALLGGALFLGLIAWGLGLTPGLL